MTVSDFDKIERAGFVAALSHVKNVTRSSWRNPERDQGVECDAKDEFLAAFVKCRSAMIEEIEAQGLAWYYRTRMLDQSIRIIVLSAFAFASMASMGLDPEEEKECSPTSVAGDEIETLFMVTRDWKRMAKKKGLL